MSSLTIKISNGSKIHIENITNLINKGMDPYFYREIRIKETELENYKDHLIFKWSEGFYESDKLPDWILKSQLLEFDVIYNK